MLQISLALNWKSRVQSGLQISWCASASLVHNREGGPIMTRSLSLLSAALALMTMAFVGRAAAQPGEVPIEFGPVVQVKGITIDPKTPVQDLLPAPKTSKAAAPFNDDLRQVTEVGVGEPISRRLQFQESVQQTADIFA